MHSWVSENQDPKPDMKPKQWIMYQKTRISYVPPLKVPLSFDLEYRSQTQIQRTENNLLYDGE